MKDRPGITPSVFGMIEAILDRIQKVENALSGSSSISRSEVGPMIMATTTDPNLGADGTLMMEYSTGAWIQGSGYCKFNGAGLSPGIGTYRIALPVLPATSPELRVVGHGTAGHGGSKDTFELIWTPSMGTACELWGTAPYTNSAPWIWGADDYISFSLHYPRI